MAGAMAEVAISFRYSSDRLNDKVIEPAAFSVMLVCHSRYHPRVGYRLRRLQWVAGSISIAGCRFVTLGGSMVMRRGLFADVS